MWQKRKIEIFPVVFLLLIVSCSPKIVETVRVETVKEVRDSLVLRDTTIFVPIPLGKDQAVVQVGDTSRRETAVALSDAWVGDDGFLHHTLENKSGELAYRITLPEMYLVSTVTNTSETARVLVKEVKVERPLTWWQKVRLRAFWWLLAAIAAFAAWTFRGPIVKFAKLWLKL